VDGLRRGGKQKRRHPFAVDFCPRIFSLYLVYMMTGLYEPSPANDLSAIRVVRVLLAFAVGREPLFATESPQERA